MSRSRYTAFNWLHYMWTRDVGREGYDKKEWQKFERVIKFMERDIEDLRTRLEKAELEADPDKYNYAKGM